MTENESPQLAIIGTGMGGATAGYALAQRGHRVLFLEKGHFLFGDAETGNSKPSILEENTPQVRLREGLWPWSLQGSTSFGDVELFGALGCGSGGTTNLYAAQLERLAPADFRPRANHAHVVDSTLPEKWPVSYEQFAPYYRRAERLFHVCGTPDPLAREFEESLRIPPPLSPRDQDIFDSFCELGLHPYRAHIGCDFIEGCGECGGALCRRACKSDAATRCLLPALDQCGAAMLPQCDVLRLEADGPNVKRIHCRRLGEEFSITAGVVVLAAGAFMSPILLMNSRSPRWPDGLANSSGMLGRNLMFHTSDMIAISPRKPLCDVGPKKAIAVNDFYFSDGKKLGTLQSVGLPVTRQWLLSSMRAGPRRDPCLWRQLSRPFLGLVAPLAAIPFRAAAVFATIVEDLPYYDNRIWSDASANSGMRFHYRYPDELRERNCLLRGRIADTLKSRHRMAVLTGENNLNYGHVCGTCRFGDDPASSVLDRNNRAHDLANLYVVDASFFPSSGGTNPALTIAANALRVADAIHHSLGYDSTARCVARS
jgi:choline dehydrogenase-like flavoprotein